MRDAMNPFNPGSGTPPPALVGRDQELTAFDVLIERTSFSRPGRGMVLTGLRGVGKTVLLNQMRRRAEAAGWFTVNIEARRDAAGSFAVRKALAREIAAKARSLNRPGITERTRDALRSVAAFNVKLGTSGIDLGVEIVSGRADSGALDIDVREVVEDLTSA
ncbi:MAG: ATP-binding protein, partial [Kineosporiaceae bacterium]|nr:ATP-binding protein [Aeromicrobium sp.]